MNKRIIWAINPFEDDSEVIRSAAWAVRGLCEDGDAEIWPVYVWEGYPPEMHFEQKKDSIEKLRTRGQESIDSVLVRVKIPSIKPLEVLQSGLPSLRSQIHALVKFADDAKGDLIVACSHGRKGLKRLALGSYAEALSLGSDIPIFLVHPGLRRKPEFRQILFATDFSRESAEVFPGVLDFAKAHGSRILIYHKVSLPTYAAFDFAYPVQKVVEKLFSKHAKSKEAEGEEFLILAKGRGIHAKLFIDREAAGSVGERILKQASRTNSIIALASQSGLVSSSLLGSTTRFVLRNGRGPIWVLHPRQAKTARRRLETAFGVKRGDVEGDLHLPLS